MTRTCSIGLKLMFFALIPLACWLGWFYTRTWVLLDVPVSLSKGTHYRSGEFTGNLNRRYFIEINAVGNDRSIKLSTVIDAVVRHYTGSPYEKLPCPFGRSRVYETIKGYALPDYRCPISPELKMHWVLSSEDEMKQGDIDERIEVGAYAWVSWMGKFDCRKGKHYNLDLDVLSDSGSLDVTNPHLYIGAYGDDYIGNSLIILVCGTIAAIGGFMLIGSFIAQRRAGRLASGPRSGMRP